MTANEAAAHPEGERLFCRYAYSPNELGYCGPAGARTLAEVAQGRAVRARVRPLAMQFSGAWVYQEIIGDMLGRDPLDVEVVRGYWTGNTEVAAIDRSVFWKQLLSVIGPRAGAYWQYLDDSLASEAAPSHAFHVLGVYPWSRLLSTGRPEPLHVLNSCCVRPADVLAVEGDRLVVEGRELVRDHSAVRFSTVRRQTVTALFDKDIEEGETVALHWGSACDRLTVDEAAVLTDSLDEQVDRLNSRLTRR
ncbi:DUF6390 family protein [Gordonia sp. PP30]|uniref:DUF6390 family protein n=1 Tax=Gordonia sp. PP30 TaxID=2935861 RepID=UPI0020003753|nr:DUF6390 family protein [Gordonia sp. PP30]UQE76480.1 DUF6390 family protein [Gordonia sp. PP30]